MKVGANYLTEKKEEKIVGQFDKIYSKLINNGYIDVLKYPGKYCDKESLELLLNILEKTECEVDIHGLPGMLPATHSKDLLTNIRWNDIPEKLWKEKTFKRISTHIGLDNRDRISNYSNEEFWTNFKDNQKRIKEILKEKTGKEIEYGGENQPGGFQIDPESLTPNFISDVWGKMDFGVFDVAHGRNSANDEKIPYYEYLKRLTNVDKVKILHVSGNTNQTEEYVDKPDKHVMLDESEFEDVLETIKTFPDLDLVITEYAYNSKYSYEKEIIIETITLKILVDTRDLDLTKKVFRFLNEKVEENGENIEEILEEIKEMRAL